ncbi:MAG: DUF4276 family protein [Anaerolineae bacterium]|nr:DUF4276 family protein [Anaerolineae bacterium]
MKKVLISVEGQTEETFLQEVLQPYFRSRLFLQPVVLKTRRVPGRPANKGGSVPYPQIKQELQSLLGDGSAIAVTTMYDFYALPHDFPGYGTLPQGKIIQKIARLEMAWADDIPQRRFHPYLQLHEFEALLFADPAQIVTCMNGTAEQQLALSRIRQTFPNPEEIDDGASSSPLHRIYDVFPAYQKVIDGSLIAMAIGLPAMRNACPHFNDWLNWMEHL